MRADLSRTYILSFLFPWSFLSPDFSRCDSASTTYIDCIKSKSLSFLHPNCWCFLTRILFYKRQKSLKSKRVSAFTGEFPFSPQADVGIRPNSFPKVKSFFQIFHIFLKMPFKGPVEAILGVSVLQKFFVRIALCRERLLVGCFSWFM